MTTRIEDLTLADFGDACLKPFSPSYPCPGCSVGEGSDVRLAEGLGRLAAGLLCHFEVESVWGFERAGAKLVNQFERDVFDRNYLATRLQDAAREAHEAARDVFRCRRVPLHFLRPPRLKFEARADAAPADIVSAARLAMREFTTYVRSTVEFAVRLMETYHYPAGNEHFTRVKDAVIGRFDVVVREAKAGGNGAD